MKRTILFRGLNKNGEWEYGDLRLDERGCYISYSVPISPSMSDPGGDTKFELIAVDYNTVGQFTGLQDKNGWDIYEGDIINDLDEAKLIEFKNGSFGIHEVGKQTVIHSTSWVVIGNIYQYPELLPPPRIQEP